MKVWNFLKAFISYLGFFLVFISIIAKANLDLFFFEPNGDMNPVGDWLASLAGRSMYFFPFMFIPIIVIVLHLISGFLEEAHGFSPKVNKIIGLVSTGIILLVQIVLRSALQVDAFYVYGHSITNYGILIQNPLLRAMFIIQTIAIFFFGFTIYAIFVGGSSYEYVEVTTYYNDAGYEVDQTTSGPKNAIWLHIVVGIACSILPILISFTPLIVLAFFFYVVLVIRSKSEKGFIKKCVIFGIIGILLIVPSILTNSDVIHVNKIHYSFNKEGEGLVIDYLDYEDEENIKHLTIPNNFVGFNITKMNRSVFKNFTSLESLTIPTVDGDQLGFYFDCNGESDHNHQRHIPQTLKKVTITNQELIGHYVLSDLPYVEELILTKNTKFISAGAISGYALKYNETEYGQYLGTETNPYYALLTPKSYPEIFRMHEDTKIIAGFSVNDKIKSIILPKGVEYLKNGEFFYLHNGRINVFYEGTLKDLENVKTSTNDKDKPIQSVVEHPIPGKTFYTYSEQEPTTEGNFWRYAEDNITPLIWE